MRINVWFQCLVIGSVRRCWAQSGETPSIFIKIWIKLLHSIKRILWMKKWIKWITIRIRFLGLKLENSLRSDKSNRFHCASPIRTDLGSLRDISTTSSVITMLVIWKFLHWPLPWAYPLFAFRPYPHHHDTVHHHHHHVDSHRCIGYPCRTGAIDFSNICVFILWLSCVRKSNLFILCARSVFNMIVCKVPHFCGYCVQQTSRFGPTLVLQTAVNVCSKSQKLDASEN